MKNLKTFESFNDTGIEIGDYVKIKGDNDYYIVRDYEEEFESSPFVLRNMITHKFKTPFKKNIVKLTPEELEELESGIAAKKYNL